MVGAIHRYLSEDHARLDDLLARAVVVQRIDVPAYEAFRAGLLRHIAMEEKVLFAEAKARSGGALKPVIERLHADHAALASMLVPTPSRPVLQTIRQLLDEHNPIEEGEHGLYHACEQLAGRDLDAVVARMRAIAPVRMSPHVDEPRVHEHIARMLAARTALAGPGKT